MSINITVTRDTILSGDQRYTPKDGEKGVKYEVTQGIQVYIRTVTPNLVKEYNSASRRTIVDEETGEIRFDPADKRILHEVVVDQCKAVTEGPKGIDWMNCHQSVLFRIRDDFLYLQAPIKRKETAS